MRAKQKQIPPKKLETNVQRSPTMVPFWQMRERRPPKSLNARLFSTQSGCGKTISQTTFMRKKVGIATSTTSISEGGGQGVSKKPMKKLGSKAGNKRNLKARMLSYAMRARGRKRTIKGLSSRVSINGKTAEKFCMSG